MNKKTKRFVLLLTTTFLTICFITICFVVLNKLDKEQKVEKTNFWDKGKNISYALNNEKKLMYFSVKFPVKSIDSVGLKEGLEYLQIDNFKDTCEFIRSKCSMKIICSDKVGKLAVSLKSITRACINNDWAKVNSLEFIIKTKGSQAVLSVNLIAALGGNFLNCVVYDLDYFRYWHRTFDEIYIIMPNVKIVEFSSQTQKNLKNGNR